MRALIVIAALVAGLVAPVAAWAAEAQVVSERPDKVAIVVYPDFYGSGLGMVSETRALDLPAGPVKISFRGVSDRIVPQTAAIQGLPQEALEQNFDFQLLSPGSLIRASQGRNLTLVRTNPATGKSTQERARVVSAPPGSSLYWARANPSGSVMDAAIISDVDGAVLDVGGHIEALKCSALPERLVFDDLPDGFVDTPTLSVQTVSPRPTRVTLTVSYLVTGIRWQANYVARLAADKQTLDLTSWITIENRSETSFRDAPAQVMAGRLQRSPDTRPTEIEYTDFKDGCWPTVSGRVPWVDPRLPVNTNGGPVVEFDPNILGGGAQNLNAIPMEILASVEILKQDLGDYKLYSLPEPTTLAAHQTKQLFMFERDGVKFDKVYRQVLDTALDIPAAASDNSVHPATTVLEFKNEKDSGLGLALPAGNVAVFQQAAGQPPILAGQPVLRDTAEGLPLEFELEPSVDVETQTRVIRRWTTGMGKTRTAHAQIEVVLDNATSKAASIELRENGVAPGLRVVAQDHSHTLKDGDLQWLVSVPASSSQTVRYTLEWRS